MDGAHEEFGPEQIRSEMLSKAMAGFVAVSEALRAGVIKVSLNGQYEIESIFIDDEGSIRFKTKGTPDHFPGIALWL